MNDPDGPPDGPDPMAPGECLALVVLTTGLFAVIGPTALQAFWLVAVVLVALGGRVMSAGGHPGSVSDADRPAGPVP